MINREQSRPLELVIADIVSAFSEWAVRSAFGSPTLNDDGSHEALFDVRFDGVHPPVALEVTSVVDGHHVATHRAAEQRIDELTRLATDQDLGRWVFEVVAGVNIKALIPVLKDIMLGGALPSAERNLPDGVLRVDHDSAGQPVAGAVVWSSAGAISLRPLDTDLRRAIADNEDKLAAANGFQRHLAVDVQALRARDPMSTAVPLLPESIDYLWVIRRPAPVIWLTDGRTPWRVRGDAFG